MAIRPPRPPRRRRPPSQIPDLVTSFVVASIVVLFLLRSLLAISGVEQWTVAWRLIDYPTDPLVSLFDSIQPFRRSLVGHFTLADGVAAAIAGILAVAMLASIAARRPQ